MLFFMTPLGGFILLVIVFSMLLLLLRLIFMIVEKLVLKRKVITQQNRTKLMWVAIVLVTFAVTTITYYDFHPRDRFYAEEWVRHTNVELPKEYRIRDKHYGSPDISGDYTTKALFVFDKEDYLNLKHKFLNDTSYHRTDWYESPELENLLNADRLNSENMKTEFVREKSIGRCCIRLSDKQNSILLDTFSY